SGPRAGDASTPSTPAARARRGSGSPPSSGSGCRSSTRSAPSSPAGSAPAASPPPPILHRATRPPRPPPPRRRPDMVDVPAQLQSVTRAYRTEERDGEEMHVQSLEQTYPAALADVWEAVTSAERIPRWFLPVSGDLRLGGRYQFEGNAGGEITACEPPSDGAAEFSATWEAMGSVSWVTVRLAEVDGERTSFELEHTSRVADVPA